MATLEMIDELTHAGDIDDFLLQQSSLRKLPQAPRRDVQSLKNWHFNHDHLAIAAEEQYYLEQNDLVAIVQKDKTPFRRLIDSSRWLRTLPFWKQRERDVPDHDAAYVSYYSDRSIDRFASAIIIAIGVAMLITPLWILQAVDMFHMKLVVITAFVLVCLLLVSLAMVAKPFEALDSTAA